MFQNIQIPTFAKNFYFIASIAFVIWMLFFDSNNLISQYSLWSKRNEITKEKNYYLTKIEEVQQERKELFSQNRLIEKFAREKYLMKKESEDIYIIED
jgi:cell division protein DivIC